MINLMIRNTKHKAISCFLRLGFLLLLIQCYQNGAAQGGQNPFELEHRIDQQKAAEASVQDNTPTSQSPEKEENSLLFQRII